VQAVEPRGRGVLEGRHDEVVAIVAVEIHV
jgi:hypothetical protein